MENPWKVLVDVWNTVLSTVKNCTLHAQLSKIILEAGGIWGNPVRRTVNYGFINISSVKS